MPRPHAVRDSVLIIDPDESIRQLIAVLLQRAGFWTECAAPTDVTSTLLDRQFDVIVRDLNLELRTAALALQALEETAPGLLQQTVILTTGRASLLQQRTSARPFAIIRKPFDVNELVDTVRQCRDRSRRAREERGSAPSSADEELAGDIDLGRLQRFIGTMPELRALLIDQTASASELLLRNELRRTSLELSQVLAEAATGERDRTRAAALRGAGRAAADLAGTAPAARLYASQREH
ncbi:MAG TPA: response regulator [Thermoanaerobaculia bacterium]|jgi:DNA-binding response OmpR family regulator